MSAYGGLAAAAHPPEERAFRDDFSLSLGIVQRGAQDGRDRIAAPRLDGEGALRYGRDEGIGRKRHDVRRASAEAVEARRRKHDRIVLSFAKLAQTRVDVAANVAIIQIAAQSFQL